VPQIPRVIEDQGWWIQAWRDTTGELEQPNLLGQARGPGLARLHLVSDCWFSTRTSRSSLVAAESNFLR
jgi:hypothetical protein